jgi:hypothetical protein
MPKPMVVIMLAYRKLNVSPPVNLTGSINAAMQNTVITTRRIKDLTRFFIGALARAIVLAFDDTRTTYANNVVNAVIITPHWSTSFFRLVKAPMFRKYSAIAIPANSETKKRGIWNW